MNYFLTKHRDVGREQQRRWYKLEKKSVLFVDVKNKQEE
jgi:hypothetical protein